MHSPNNVQTSRLSPILKDISHKLSGNADALIEKFVPASYLPMLRTAKLILGSKLDPSKLLDGGLAKLDALPEEFWVSIEELIRRVLDGDEDATAKLRELLGV